MPPELPKKKIGKAAEAPGAEQAPKRRVDYTQTRTLGDPDQERTDRMIAELQELMRQVKREYDLWFSGTNAKPPYEQRNKLDTHVRLLRNRLPRRVSDQFRIGTVLQLYQSYAELWDKSSRKQEEGGVAPWMQHSRRNPLDLLQEENEKRQEEAREKQKTPYLARITSPEQDVDEMRKVFNSYVAAKKKVGDDTSGADFEKFRTALVKQSRQLIDSGKAQAVAYRIEIQDGKVAIKAKGE